MSSFSISKRDYLRIGLSFSCKRTSVKAKPHSESQLGKKVSDRLRFRKWLKKPHDRVRPRGLNTWASQLLMLVPPGTAQWHKDRSSSTTGQAKPRYYDTRITYMSNCVPDYRLEPYTRKRLAAQRWSKHAPDLLPLPTTFRVCCIEMHPRLDT